VLSVLLAVLVLPASAAPTREGGLDGCRPSYISGNTFFVYLQDDLGCRPYLVYSATYILLEREYPDIFQNVQTSLTNTRFSGWIVVYQIGGGVAEDVVMQRWTATGRLEERVYQTRPAGGGTRVRDFTYALPPGWSFIN